jgi:hypothetical protein
MKILRISALAIVAFSAAIAFSFQPAGTNLAADPIALHGGPQPFCPPVCPDLNK